MEKISILKIINYLSKSGRDYKLPGGGRGIQLYGTSNPKTTTFFTSPLSYGTRSVVFYTCINIMIYFLETIVLNIHIYICNIDDI